MYCRLLTCTKLQESGPKARKHQTVVASISRNMHGSCSIQEASQVETPQLTPAGQTMLDMTSSLCSKCRETFSLGLQVLVPNTQSGLQARAVGKDCKQGLHGTSDWCKASVHRWRYTSLSGPCCSTSSAMLPILPALTKVPCHHCLPRSAGSGSSSCCVSSCCLLSACCCISRSAAAHLTQSPHLLRQYTCKSGFIDSACRLATR